MCFSKLALVTFVRGLTMVILDRQLSLALEALIGAWAIVGVFGIAFACHLPHPWDYVHEQCFNTVCLPDIMMRRFADRIDGMVELPWSQQYHYGHGHSCTGHCHHYPASDQRSEKGDPRERIRLPSTVRPLQRILWILIDIS